MSDTVQDYFRSQATFLLSGAMGTEILNRGVSTELPLWSAEALLTHPIIVREIHEDYIRAGAEIIVTNTFRTHRRVLALKNHGDKAEQLTVLACELAQQARAAVGATHPVYIAGSVAPLEDCYSPELTPSDAELEAEHAELARHLRQGGVDFLLIETMITVRETLAALHAAQAVGLPAAVSFCCNDRLQLLSGESLQEAVAAVEKFNLLFIGVNCVSQTIATAVVKHFKTITQLPIVVYAQGDGIPNDEQGWQFTHQSKEQSYLQSARQWLADGAQVIGSCCGSTPDYTKGLRKLVGNR